MSEPLDVTTAKRKLAIMGIVNAAAVVGAVAALLGYFRFHLTWALAVFVALVAVGIAAQVWFIAALRRASKGA